jgi:hypothetical protein
MSIINVSSAAGLMSALTNARGGETIVLASGNYGDLNLSSRTFASAVTIKSADPGDPAKIGGVQSGQCREPDLGRHQV